MNPSEQEHLSAGWLTHRAFGALDWANQKHAAVVVDAQGKVVEDFEFEHSAAGWKSFRERLQPYGSIPFAISDQPRGGRRAAIRSRHDRLPAQPQKRAGLPAAQRPESGAKDDRLDAWSFADACRVDGHGWRPLRPEDPLVKELRLLCRDEVTLIEQRTAFIHQLRQALAEYYPMALEAFEDWTAVAAWRFVQRFPTPQLLQQAGKRHWEKFLHSHHLWQAQSGPRRLELFAHATDFGGSAPTAQAKSRLALSLVEMLLVLEKQLELYRKRIEELFRRHPDHDLFGSLPGVGPKLAPRLLSELGDDRDRFGGEPQALQCWAGTAPVTRRSGKYRSYHQRSRV